MKRFLSIFILFTFLSSNTVFGEVLKLPLLIQHYIVHIQGDNDTSITNFLVQHYNGNINHDHQGNNHDHDNLPFKTVGSHFSPVISFMSPPIVELAHHTIIMADMNMPAGNQQNYSNAYLNSIWQPPRLS